MNASITPEQQQTALDWLTRINGQPALAEGAAFKRWLLSDPAHAQAWRDAQALWQRSEAPAVRLAVEEDAALQAYLRAMDRPATSPWRKLGGLAVAASVLLMLGVGAGWHPADWLRDFGADHVAAVGEVREVTLADNSRLTLDADTAIKVDFSNGQRRVEVQRGAVFFQVTHTGQPFIVEADGGRTEVLGTKFEVRRQEGGAEVTVLSGRVGVTAADGQAQQVLTANQQVDYRDGHAGSVHGVDSETRLAWRQGWLNYYQVPLQQVVDDLARYYPGRILLLDGDLGTRKVSGSFPADDPLAALDALGAVAGFQRHTLLGRVTLLR
ncbi:FecR family protein [Pseudomonas sp. 148P]|uniref:FecR family protein n=1 Tax=Pseudomonas ulcerans TaxID=3115852 RepID=A0ABU7HRW4_9PSED|nr:MULTISPECIES: FecR family protein [unclassified Pseudomonas]MEE1923241.1 FecR family protein [Pseudomonas sp. 147P]MEE1934203.1 FecR family protein [Pseudomonas sp. 148P]